MHAFRVASFDTAAAIQTIATPRPGTGEVLLDIAACGMNFADILMARGTYQDTPDPPFTLGMEVCGTVRAHGDGVDAPAVGTRVVVFAGQGGLAERGVFPAALCRPVPDSMPSDVAAGFQVACGTAHLALTRRARLHPDETLLVLGAAGGVGLAAVEIGKVLGAQVIAVARGSEKVEAGDDVTAQVRALGGADVVFDPVGGAAFTAALRATNREGRIITIGFASGEVPPVPANHLLVKNIDVIGFYWGGYPAFAPQALTDSLTELMGWYAAGRLRPHVSHVLPLDRASEALELIRSRRSTGKVVVVPPPA
jgi:NADPH2:quinone reductase